VKFAITMFLLRAPTMVELTLQAEKLGYESMWLGEHIITPASNASNFPYAGENDEHGNFNAHIPFFDAYGVFSYLSALTTRIKFALGVSIVPLHDPFHLSRQVATLDILSNGRFSLGVGTGWLKEEFDIMGLDFSKRAKRLEEALDIMESLFVNDITSYDGEHFKVPPIGFSPKPVSQPRPPFIFGGHAPVALKRAAMRGDGWMGVDLEPDALKPSIDALKAYRADSPRAGEPFMIASGYRKPLDRDKVKRFEDIGVELLMVSPWARGREAVEGITKFADALF
jgi:probable F420-dependent oxidoreductase